MFASPGKRRSSLVADKLNAVRAAGLLDETGYPRVAASFGGGGTPTAYMGTLPAFLAAWGPIDMSFGSGQGVKCYHSEHLYGELWHRAFTVSPDTPLCEYLVSFGANVEASGGVCGVKRHADARKRGMKRVQIEPHLSVTGACSAEWIPIKPKTDSAFLFAMIHVFLHEHPRDRLDLPFLKHRTSSPYLVGPNGLFMRDPSTRKPLVIDGPTGRAVPFDTAGIDPALEGSFVVDGVEVGPDDEIISHNAVTVSPAFVHLVAHVKELFAGMGGADLRCAGRHHPPYRQRVSRPRACRRDDRDRGRDAAIAAGLDLARQDRQQRLGRLRVLLGAHAARPVWSERLEVPGGTLGTTVRLNRPADNRWSSVKPGPGRLHALSDEPNRQERLDLASAGAQRPPHVGAAGRQLGLEPGARTDAPGLDDAEARTSTSCRRHRRRTCGSSIAPIRRFRSGTPKPSATRWRSFHSPSASPTRATRPTTWPTCCCPTAPTLRGCSSCASAAPNMSSNSGTTRVLRCAIRRCLPQGEAKDFTWIATELARRTGLLEAYNSAINRGAAGVRLSGANYDFSLAPDKKHDVETIWDASCRAASAELTDGAESQGLDWFREHGFRVKPFPRLQWYLYPKLVQEGLRFEQPYQERLFRVGKELGRRLHEQGINWWDKQLDEYEPLPHWRDLNGLWEDALAKHFRCVSPTIRSG